MKNLSGKKFNKLTAIKIIRKSKKGNVWLCKCDCGKYVEVPIISLTQNWKGSCGCLVGGIKPQDLTGRIFGKLTVISYKGRISTKMDKNHKTLATWECNCSCGNTIIKTSRALLHDKTKSCGCLQKNAMSINGKKKIRPDTFLIRYFKIYKYQAKCKNHKWELSLEEFKKLVNNNCYLCGNPPEPKSLCRAKFYNKDILFNGIDRIDSLKGYSSDNCKPCCSMCNTLKMDLNYDIFINKIKTILKFIGN